MVVSADPVYPVIWQDPHLLMINQTRLPREYSYLEVSRCEDVIEAIRTSMVRGEAAGIAAAYGLYLGMRGCAESDRKAFLLKLEAIAQTLKTACPSVLDISWAVEEMLTTARAASGSTDHLNRVLLDTAKAIHAENLQACQAIGRYGLQALPSEPAQLRLLTHANAGALSSGGYGTALGIVRATHTAGRLAKLYITETRPRFQGGRLSAWECLQEEIAVTIIVDSAAAACMQKGMIDAVIVGADLIARNGDTANRIGTYSLAVLANAHQIPFYVAAPSFVVDFNLASGEQIPLENRPPSDIYQVEDTLVCPPNAAVLNPALDVTPAYLITAIVTDKGSFAPSDLYQLLEH